MGQERSVPGEYEGCFRVCMDNRKNRRLQKVQAKKGYLGSAQEDRSAQTKQVPIQAQIGKNVNLRTQLKTKDEPKQQNKQGNSGDLEIGKMHIQRVITSFQSSKQAAESNQTTQEGLDSGLLGLQSRITCQHKNIQYTAKDKTKTRARLADEPEPSSAKARQLLNLGLKKRQKNYNLHDRIQEMKQKYFDRQLENEICKNQSKNSLPLTQLFTIEAACENEQADANVAKRSQFSKVKESIASKLNKKRNQKNKQSRIRATEGVKVIKDQAGPVRAKFSRDIQALKDLHEQHLSEIIEIQNNKNPEIKNIGQILNIEFSDFSQDFSDEIEELQQQQIQYCYRLGSQNLNFVKRISDSPISGEAILAAGQKKYYKIIKYEAGNRNTGERKGDHLEKQWIMDRNGKRIVAF